VNAGSKLLGRETIRLGDFSVIGYDCLLMTSTDRPAHALANDFILEEHRKILSESIVIGRHAFIGSKSTLMPGCKIPEGCVVGQGSVVTCIESLAMKPWTVYFADGSERPREVSP
jgi:acetyltransferase-like isoleucine patch superfamily enzyme